MIASTATVLTLDAGGTNFVFSAIKDFKEITSPVTLPANADNLEKCLANLISGFEQVAVAVGKFDAISFAFPGPADYELGIIGDLPNFTAFNGDVAVGPMLQARFNVPVFINNDGNLFASGVALAGYLPQLNERLRKAGSKKQFKNVIGITLGTGIGCGIVLDGKMVMGDNSCGAEIHNTLNPFYPKWNAEESVSTRAIQRVYAEQAGLPFNASMMPKQIYEIATGMREGNKTAALESFRQYGQALGGSVANVLTLIDGLVVIGGGLSAGWKLFAPAMFEELNRNYETFKGEKTSRLSYKVFNLEDPSVFDSFAKGEMKTISIPGTDKTIEFDGMPRTGVALSNIDGSFAISLGAYALAIQHLSAGLHDGRAAG
jgi:glucokinase